MLSEINQTQKENFTFLSYAEPRPFVEKDVNIDGELLGKMKENSRETRKENGVNWFKVY
jgi:hypothetical protein